jgi:hypothetical protein
MNDIMVKAGYLCMIRNETISNTDETKINLANRK